MNNQVYKAVVIIWITLSVASVLLAAINWSQLHRKLKASADTVALHDAVDAVLRSLVDAETAQRGFTISGSDAFLEPLEEAKEKLPTQFNRLAELARSDPTILNHVMDLRARAEVSMEQQSRIVTLRRKQGVAAAAELVSTGPGLLVMDQIRTQVAQIKSRRSFLSSPEGRESRSQLLQASLTSLVAGAIGIGAGLFALYLARVSLRHQNRERELLEAKLKAEHESQEKSTFLANMSHEIRTPMNAILGFSELLSEELHEPKHREYLRSIRTSAASLLQLINDILDMSKVEAGVLELRLDPTDPREICDFITTVFTEPAAKKGIELECRVAQNLPRALLLDRGRLRQVLVNLVGNAVKFTDRGSIYTTVTCEKEQSHNSHITLIIEVEDTGVGIPQEKLEAIFKPFVQAGGHRDKEKMGTGLGLAIVNHLTQLMGGTVTVASVVGQGSAFHLRFPNVLISAQLPAGERADTSGVADFTELRRSKILVVDDNEMNCRLLAGMFEGSHHQLDYGVDGREAVEKARTIRPDVVLMDIRMPNMNGREALEEIRKTPGLEMVPVIAVTASSLLEDEKSLRDLFSGYLKKPFTRRELFKELSQFLPRFQKGDAADPAPRKAPVEGASHDAPAWRDWAAQLRGLAAEEWPGVRDSLAVNETRAFAHKLEALARETHCQPLLAYSDALIQYADTYAVDALEKHLQNFPALIERIERASV